MTREEVIRKALEYVQATGLEVGSLAEVKYIDLNHLEAKAKDCPPDLLETYSSVRKNFRNQWAVSFKTNKISGQVSCPEIRMVCVFETCEVTLFSSP